MVELSLEKGKYASIGSPAALKHQLEQEGRSVFPWQDRSGAYYSPHQHSHDEFIVVYEGRIVFLIAGERYEIEPGDQLNLPANTVHEAINEDEQTVRYFICS
jgi:mannose-6-phosphate isomerase-like protein (cupin superfamily)